MHEVDENMDDQLEYIILVIVESPFMKAHIYDALYSDKDDPLYKCAQVFPDYLCC